MNVHGAGERPSDPLGVALERAPHPSNEKPGVGQQAGPALPPFPSPHSHPPFAGRLIAAETLPSRRRPPRAISLAVLATAIALLTACDKVAAAPAFERPPAPVEAAPAVGRDVPVYLDEIGRAVAKETVWVRSQVSARIVEAHFEDGAELAKGDLLYTLDARPFEARLAAADAALGVAQAALVRSRTATLRPEAALARARSARDLALAEFARVEHLVESKAVSRADFDVKKNAVTMSEADVRDAEAAVKTAEPDEAEALAAVKRAEADVAAARLDVEYCTLRSPIAGRAGTRLVDAGNLIESMSSPLVMVERLDPVYVDFTVTEANFGAVQTNRAKGALRVEVSLPDDPGAARTGELTFVDNTVDQATGTLKLRATIANADRRFWPGRFVRVRLVLETLPGAVLVPATAPQMSAKGSYVYVVKADGTAEMRPVALGQRQGDLVVVKDGVAAGERVVVAGQLAVTPGGKVRVEGDGAAPAPVAPK